MIPESDKNLWLLMAVLTLLLIVVMILVYRSSRRKKQPSIDLGDVWLKPKPVYRDTMKVDGPKQFKNVEDIKTNMVWNNDNAKPNNPGTVIIMDNYPSSGGDYNRMFTEGVNTDAFTPINTEWSQEPPVQDDSGFGHGGSFSGGGADGSWTPDSQSDIGSSFDSGSSFSND